MNTPDDFTDEDIEWCVHRTTGLMSEQQLTLSEASDKAITQRVRWKREQFERPIPKQVSSELEQARTKRTNDLRLRSQGLPTLTTRPFAALLKGK